MTGRAHELDASLSGATSLRGPLLGLLVEQEQPIASYRLSSLLMQRLPEWGVSHSAISNLLKRLAAAGYATVSGSESVAYTPTEKARAAVDAWMAGPLCRQTIRQELHARIASASPRHAALIYAAVEAYERECFELLDDGAGSWEPDTPAGSWRSLTIGLTRAASDETLRGHIRWSQLAKRALKDWMLAHGQPLPAAATNLATTSIAPGRAAGEALGSGDGAALAR
jgi:DNA-binding PadR family transcriptional regulator